MVTLTEVLLFVGGVGAGVALITFTLLRSCMNTIARMRREGFVAPSPPRLDSRPRLMDVNET